MRTFTVSIGTVYICSFHPVELSSKLGYICINSMFNMSEYVIRNLYICAFILGLPLANDIFACIEFQFGCHQVFKLN